MVILGAVLAMLGAWLSNTHTSKIAEKAERRKIRREKLEQLALLLNSIEEWLDLAEENVFCTPPKSPPSSPLDMIRVLGELYFPELEVKIHALYLEAMAVHGLVYDEASRRIKEIGAANNAPAKPASADPSAMRPYMEKRREALFVMLKKKSDLQLEICQVSKNISNLL